MTDDCFPLESYEEASNGYYISGVDRILRKLAAAVITVVIKDIEYIGDDVTALRDRDKAIAWVQSERKGPGTFIWYAEIIGITDSIALMYASNKIAWGEVELD